MPRMPKIKVELKNPLPSDPAERNRLKKVIQEGVDAKIAQKDAASQFKDIVAVEKDSHNYDPKFIKTLVAAEFDRQYQAGKKRKDLEEQVEQMTEADILFGRGTPNVAQTEADDGEEGSE
ncbi:hypothetical protein [Enterobacter phage EC152]